MRLSRKLWAGGIVAAVALAPSIASATGDVEAAGDEIGHLTLLASTDLHGTAAGYDYYTGADFGATNPANTRGMDRLSTAIAETRETDGADSVLLLDNGDANQGNSLASVYHANRTDGTVDPMAALFNHLDYDAGVVGNHEFNYGLDDLAQYEDNLDMPVLGANVLVADTEDPYLTPWTMVEKTTADGHTVNVGIIGVVTPGVRIWDSQYVEGVLDFQPPVTAVQRYIPEVEAAGADVIVVLAHTGLDDPGYVWTEGDLEEDVATTIAKNTSGIDVIVGGHSHQTNNVQVYLENAQGDEVLFTQPGFHGRFLSSVDIPLQLDEEGDPEVVWSDDEKPTAQALQAAVYDVDPEIIDVIQPWYDNTLEWVGQVVAQATETMPATTSVYEDTPIVDFISKVQTDEVERALAGTEYAGLPVISVAAPFSRTAVFSEGDVTVADMAALYIYDNTLMAVELSGAELKDYLEYAARYYKQVEEDAEYDPEDITNAVYPTVPNGIPDYSYDILSGVDYHINISKDLGERIEKLSIDGTPVAADDRIVLVLNNYRQSGGSGYPHVVDAPIIYDEQKSIRDLMIDWAITNETIDPADFFVENWTVSSSTVLTEEPEQPVPLKGNVFHLSNSWTSSTGDVSFAFGKRGDQVFVGDWDGNGTDTLGVRRGNTFYLMNSLAGGNADKQFNYGKATDEILVGDWDGDGTDTLGVRRGNTYFLKNTLAGGNADEQFNYGKATDEALVGDWDGDTTDTIAVRRGTTFHVVNAPRGGNAEVSYNYGRLGDRAYAGDFDGDGVDTIALVRGTTFLINNSHVGGPADSTLNYGRSGDSVIIGDWDGDGTDTPGVNRIQ
ncbi:MAG: 5'-nucleotidase C-terminal domain-containing protein [Flaviflexus sp.]|uniref:bifunctional metallophosphatase/5'-nucleotidase n=1 Tax=Flaviflexus sp. TaxID=1969482 RepID=UPI00352C39EA